MPQNNSVAKKKKKRQISVTKKKKKKQRKISTKYCFSLAKGAILYPRITHHFKGCGMGTMFVLVFPCFRENVVITCKIGSFLCSLDNLLQKNIIVFFFGNQISKWCSFEKRVIFDLLFTFFSHQGKVAKIPSAHISLTYIHVFCSPYWLFFALTNFEKNTNLSGTWFLFGMSPGVDSYSRHFGTINK